MKVLKKPTVTETVRLNRLRWFVHVQRMEGNRIPKKELYMNLGTRLGVRPRNKRHDEVREDGRLVGGEWWKEKVYNREEGRKLLRTSRNRCILHTSMECVSVMEGGVRVRNIYLRISTCKTESLCRSCKNVCVQKMRFFWDRQKRWCWVMCH